MLNEPFGWFERACAFLCMVGAVFVTKPSFLGSVTYWDDDDHVRMLGFISAFLGAICSAFAYVSVRKAGPEAHFFNHMLSLSLATIIFGLFDFQSYTLPQATIYPYIVLAAIGLSAFIGQCLLNKG